MLSLAFYSKFVNYPDLCKFSWTKISVKPVFMRFFGFGVIITPASILLTIPVAFIYTFLLNLQICTVSICKTRRFILVFYNIIPP